MASDETTSSQTTRVFAEIREDILTGKIAPEAPLRIAALANRLGASTSVVREALIRLSERNLVSATLNQGFRVAGLSAEELQDLTELRVDLEVKALRESIEKGDRLWEANAVAAHYLMVRETSDAAERGWDVTREYREAHSDFHDALISACERPRLLRLVRSLREEGEVYYRLNADLEWEPEADARADHQKLLDFSLARKPDEAAEVLAEHLRSTARAWMKGDARRTAAG